MSRAVPCRAVIISIWGWGSFGVESGAKGGSRHVRAARRVPGPLQVDRDALLHRNTVGLACGWLDAPMTCGYGWMWGVVSKDVHGSDGGNGPRNGGGNDKGRFRPYRGGSKRR